MEMYPDVKLKYERNGWSGDLIWCPSQLYKTVNIDGKVYELYLRWRHSDPWEFYIDTKFMELDMELDKEFLAEEYEELIDYIDMNIEEIIKEKDNAD